MNTNNLAPSQRDSDRPVLPRGAFFGCSLAEHRVGEMFLSLRRADPYRVVERHSHEDAHFVLVLEGSYVSSAAGIPSASSHPLLVYNPPGTTHRDHFAGHGGVFSGAFFTLSTPAELDHDETGRRLGEGAARAVVHPAAIALAGVMARECQRWDDVSSLAVEAGALELLHHTLATRNTPAQQPPRWLYRAVEQVYACDGGSCSLRQLAADAGVHPVYLARAFQHFMGCTPAALVRRHRLRKALAWIRGTPRPLSEISAACGYADHSHMSRAVHAAVGCSPSAYRSATR